MAHAHNSNLQAHSVGETYPWTVTGGGEIKYLGRFADWNKAEEAAEAAADGGVIWLIDEATAVEWMEAFQIEGVQA